MISPNLQHSLFGTPKIEALKQAKTSESIASQWYKLNYLSFDITNVDELSDPQFLELIFLSKLFSSGLSLDTIENLLSKISKPYSYDYRKVYFDLFDSEWKYLPEEADDEDDDEEDDHEVDIQDVKSYLSSLDKNDDLDEIELYLDILHKYLR